MKRTRARINEAWGTLTGRSMVRTNILIFLVSAAALVLLFALFSVLVQYTYDSAYQVEYYYFISETRYSAMGIIQPHWIITTKL